MKNKKSCAHCAYTDYSVHPSSVAYLAREALGLILEELTSYNQQTLVIEFSTDSAIYSFCTDQNDNVRGVIHSSVRKLLFGLLYNRTQLKSHVMPIASTSRVFLLDIRVELIGLKTVFQIVVDKAEVTLNPRAHHRITRDYH